MEAGKEEQRAVVRFLTAEGVSGSEIHARMSAVYGEHSMSRARVFEWNKRFREGRMSLKDNSRPGQAHLVSTPRVIAAVDAAVRNDRRLTVENIRLMLDISHGTAHAILTEHLKFRKICAQWVPHNLTEEQKLNRMSTSMQHLERYHDEEYSFLSRIVTGDETWCHHFEPESKRQSQQWKHVDSPRPKKSKAVHTSSGKVMMTFFFDCKGPLLIDFLEHGATINAQRYVETLQTLKRAIKSKRPGMLTDGIILLQDNARPHVARVVSTTLQNFRWEALTHPPYSPDLSPCDFHIFGALKKDIRGRRFASDEEVHAWVKSWFRRQPKSFFHEGIDRLVSQWDKCINSYGDYF